MIVDTVTPSDGKLEVNASRKALSNTRVEVVFKFVDYVKTGIMSDVLQFRSPDIGGYLKQALLQGGIELGQ